MKIKICNQKIRKFLLLDDPCQKQPWRRFFARAIDFTICAKIAKIIGYSIISDDEQLNQKLAILFIFWPILILPFWAVIESYLLSKWSKTPGKWMFGISVITLSNAKLSFKAAISRTIQVFVKGLGLNIPVINLFTLNKSFRNLVNDGGVIWDQSYGTKVVFSKPSIFGIAGLILIILDTVF